MTTPLFTVHPREDDDLPTAPHPSVCTTPDHDTGADPAVQVSTVSAAPGVIRVDVHGVIDIATAAEFRARLFGVLDHPSCATVVVDLRRVEFMGARSIDVLADLSDHAAGLDIQLVVVATNGALLRLLQTTGAGGVYSTVAAALAGVDLATVDTGRGGDRG